MTGKIQLEVIVTSTYRHAAGYNVAVTTLEPSHSNGKLRKPADAEFDIMSPRIKVRLKYMHVLFDSLVCFLLISQYDCVVKFQSINFYWFYQ